MSVRNDLETVFPQLISTHYRITSPYDHRYNCIAWAAGDSSTWWEPDPMNIYYWPPSIQREYSIEAYQAVYENLGFREHSKDNLEPDSIKVAIFSKAGKPTHAARQLESGLWTSKLGKNVDIEHILRGIVGDCYGNVEVILKRRRDNLQL